MLIEFYELEGTNETAGVDYTVAKNTITGKKALIVMADDKHMTIIEEE